MFTTVAGVYSWPGRKGRSRVHQCASPLASVTRLRCESEPKSVCTPPTRISAISDTSFLGLPFESRALINTRDCEESVLYQDVGIR